MAALQERFRENMRGKSDAELAEMALGSPAVHFASCVTIHNKDNEVTRPVPNILQLRMSEVYELCMALGVPCRMIVCKPRQVGCSTFASHICYHHGMRWRSAGITISDKSANSQKLMMKVRDYGVVDRFPWGIRQLKDTSMGLSWTNGTRWEVDSAENWKAGIGDTRQVFHSSETAKWPKTGVKNDKRVMAAVLPSISKGRSVVIAESTPEGANGWFYETWQEAVDVDEFLERRASGVDSGIVWIKVFAAWFEFVEHQRKEKVKEHERVEMERSITEREVALRERGISWEQLAWRRDMIRTECGGSEDIFDEYYPEDDVRCLKHDTLVPTARGMLPISLVQVGDKLSNGTVVAVSKTGYRPVHEVETSRGFRLECTYDHRLKLAGGGGFVRAVDSVGSVVELAAPIFSEEDYVHEWVGPAGVQCRLPITEDWARFIGYYEGDGSFYKNQLSLVVGSKDEDMKPLLLDLWLRLFGTIPQERKFKHARCHELRAASSDYAALFDALGLTDTSGEWRKRKVGVPEFIWRCPKPVVREFLRGLFEADGHVRSRGTAVQFFSKHKRFCQDVLLLLLGFGVHGKLRPVTAKLKGKEYPGWQIVIYKGYVGRYFEKIGFLSARKQAEGNGRFHVKNNGRKSEVLGMEDEVVRYSEQAEEREVWDLTMSNKPEFCANGIMVHNCFAVSGRPAFDVEALMAMEKRARGISASTGHLVMQESGSVSWSPRSDGGGDIQVWEEPREGCRYLVACDPATGEDQTTGKNPDRTSIGVWRQGYFDPVTGIDHRTRLVARVRSPFFGAGDEVAGHIMRLSRWYGGAIVVIEVNMGIHVVDRCKEAGIPLYMRKVPSARIGSEVMQYGYKLRDPEQRRQAVDALRVAIREQALDIACMDWIHEAKMFVVAKNGREEARGGEHDDDILMSAMAWYSMTSATEYRRTVRKRKLPSDYHSWKRIGSASRGW
jgi:hypothetical protein